MPSKKEIIEKLRPRRETNRDFWMYWERKREENPSAFANERANHYFNAMYEYESIMDSLNIKY